jgi:uncharacterized membrane protein
MNKRLTRWVFLAHLASTLYMVGLIWIVQVVHYPLFAMVGSDGFSAFEQRHAALMTWVVAPPMLIEAATAVMLFWCRPASAERPALWTGAGLLCVIWLSTALIQVPCHDGLSRGFDPLVHQRLVWSNWVRTAAWSLRGLIVLRMASMALGTESTLPERQAIR